MNYTANDLQTLSPGRAYREKIGMYLSADRQEAIDLGLRELIYNAQDEFEATHQKNAFVKISIDTTTQEIQVEDNMRGIPVAVRDDGINSLTAAFLIPHSGAKHKEGVYQAAVGVNGQGNKIVCHTSKWLRVQVCRDGNIYQQSFHETDEGAVPDNDIQVLGKTAATGTKITYVPSEIVYQGARIDIDNLIESLTMLSYFTKGLKIILSVDEEEMEFYSAHGLADGLKAEDRLHKNILHFQRDYEDCSVELALQWNKGKGEIRPYANNLYVKDGGAFISGFRSSLTKTFNTICGSSFSGEQIRRGLDGFVSVKVHNVQFTNQQKSSLANPEARTATSAAITEALKTFAANNPDDFNKIVAILSKEQKADEAAERARNAILNQEKKEAASKRRKVQMPDKFKDCEKHGEDSLLIICEGNSALAGLMPARDVNTEALYAVRGKVKNLLKHPLEECLENQEISDIICALGCGIQEKYNSKKLNYGKVAIAVDADVDGKNIMCLIATMFSVLMPQFIEEGRLCWLQAPLYKLEKDGKRVFAYNNEELKELKKTRANWEQTRMKGLGELRAIDMEESMMSKDNRHLEILRIADFESAMESLNILMGAGRVKERRDFLFENVDFGALYE